MRTVLAHRLGIVLWAIGIGACASDRAAEAPAPEVVAEGVEYTVGTPAPPAETIAPVRGRHVISAATIVAEEGFLERFAATNRFRSGHPARVTLTPEGRSALYLRSGARDRTQSLYELDLATGQERLLLSAERLLGGGEERLTEEELARRERQRQTARGLVSFDLSDDGRLILAQLSDTLYVFDRETETTRAYRSDAGAPIDPKLSPDGTMLACVRDGDLYVTDLATGEERRLTVRPSETIEHGVAEFVAQEEMSRHSGYWWSPDGSRIAYCEVDTSDVEIMRIMDPFDPSKEAQTWRYPRAGTQNARVRLGIIGVEGGPTNWVDWDGGRHPYLASALWSEGAPLTILVQNRAQTEQALLAVDAETGYVETLLVERDEAWLNIDESMPRWLPGGDAFLWTTERSGMWELELRARDGSFIRTVAPMEQGYRGFVGLVDEGRTVYYTASDEPAERHLWRASVRGLAPAERLSRERGMHTGEVSRDGSVIAHHRDLLSGERGWTVRARSGQLLAYIPSVAEAPGFDARVEITSVQGPLSQRAAIVRPRNFLPGEKYPVILHVYGGPGNQMATTARSRYAFSQWLADHGFIVVMLDGRGTPSRGRDWERAIKWNFIDAPLADQVDGLRRLASRHPEMDLERVGVYGWSFGGYFSAMAAMREPEVFDAAFVGAPVCDWRDYDTHYTERYIGLPQENPEAYEVSNVLTYADRLEVPLLIVHGTADDNVYFTHALKMSDALTRAGRAHEFIPLAGLTHVVTDLEVVERMWERMRDFFVGELGYIR